jgi:RimJ/RimL family protein N-acetyltransferase
MDNFEQLYKLFKEDQNPFVLKNFKNLQEARLYAEDRVQAEKRPKQAGCDWLVKIKPDIYAGILHLYDLSIETNAHSCCIGIVIAEYFREQGIATEAIKHLLKYIFNHFEQINTVIVYTKPENFKMVRLLKKLNFSPSEHKKFIYSDAYSFFMLKKAEFDI